MLTLKARPTVCGQKLVISLTPVCCQFSASVMYDGLFYSFLLRNYSMAYVTVVELEPLPFRLFLSSVAYVAEPQV